MNKPKSGPNAEVGAIVSKVMGDMTLEQAAIKLGYKLSKEAIRALRNGKIGREATVRTFAQGFHAQICAEYGVEVTQDFGACTEETAADWLARKAEFGEVGLYYTPAPVDLGEIAARLNRFEQVLKEVTRAGIVEALGAAEWRTPINEEFRRVVNDIVERSPAMPYQGKEVRQIIRGVVPPEDELASEVTKITNDPEEVNAIFRAAGYGNWDGTRILLLQLHELMAEYGTDPVRRHLPQEALTQASAMTPNAVNSIITELRLDLLREQLRSQSSPEEQLEFAKTRWASYAAEVAHLAANLYQRPFTLTVPPGGFPTLRDAFNAVVDQVKKLRQETGLKANYDLWHGLFAILLELHEFDESEALEDARQALAREIGFSPTREEREAYDEKLKLVLMPDFEDEPSPGDDGSSAERHGRQYQWDDFPEPQTSD